MIARLLRLFERAPEVAADLRSLAWVGRVYICTRGGRRS